MSNQSPATNLDGFTPSVVSDKSTFDPTYAARYKDRNARKLAKILERLQDKTTTLDIGCNNGYLDNGILNENPSCICHAIELDRSAIEFDLLSNPQFTLFETNVTDFCFSQVYDAVVYNAVHHHVFGKFGEHVAMRVWDNIIDHCNQTLIFETGVLSEKGRYYWKTAIRNRYKTDQLHIAELLRRIGSRLKSVEVIDQVPIHGTKRDLLCISLHPLESEFDLKRNPHLVFDDLDDVDDQFDVVQTYRRTCKSRNQKLVPVSDCESIDDDRLYAGTVFRTLTQNGPGGERSLFAKKIDGDFYKAAREYMVHRQVDHPRVIDLVGYSNKYGFLFPQLNWQTFEAIDWRQIENSEAVRDEVESFFDFASSAMIETGLLDLEPGCGRQRKLIDIVDWHPCNFLAEVNGGRVSDWRVIDLEYYSNDNAARNERHRNHLMRRLSGTSAGVARVWSTIARAFE